MELEVSNHSKLQTINLKYTNIKALMRHRSESINNDIFIYTPQSIMIATEFLQL